MEWRPESKEGCRYKNQLQIRENTWAERRRQEWVQTQVNLRFGSSKMFKKF